LKADLTNQEFERLKAFSMTLPEEILEETEAVSNQG
jgi:hypothetical protein